jgi:hypothetical protein
MRDCLTAKGFIELLNRDPQKALEWRNLGNEEREHYLRMAGVCEEDIGVLVACDEQALRGQGVTRIICAPRTQPE